MFSDDLAGLSVDIVTISGGPRCGQPEFGWRISSVQGVLRKVASSLVDVEIGVRVAVGKHSEPADQYRR
jgi:hypothetical protein